MQKSCTLWMLVLSLVLTRLLGLHLHACTGVESQVAHASAHYADDGLLFGEHHGQDDADDREVDLVTIAASSIHFELDDLLTLIPSGPKQVSLPLRLLATAPARGLPAGSSSQSSHFAPPLRGPPHSLA